ncbi:hypothetical protein BKA56DRAFT_133312 [Ilyonectria sp. MPI-CAGE-AT-0026]|nr:hypothetical protein BKA56DRAFT_133312 [Ilyonectria sp. MPI-CAGE-AT-0026]
MAFLPIILRTPWTCLTLGFDEIRLLYPEKDEFVVDGVFYCDREGCSDSFRTYRNRNKHIREAEKPVVCPYCGIRMPYQSDMKKHAKTHVNEDLRERFPCTICGKLYTRYDNVLKHQNRNH